jgi:hypothetical protein
VPDSKLHHCRFAAARDGKTCDAYAAPSLWCASCSPRLAEERGIDLSRWDERTKATGCSYDTLGHALYAMWVDGPGSDREAGYFALNPDDIEAWERIARGIVERPDDMRRGLLGVI